MNDNFLQVYFAVKCNEKLTASGYASYRGFVLGCVSYHEVVGDSQPFYRATARWDVFQQFLPHPIIAAGCHGNSEHRWLTAVIRACVLLCLGVNVNVVELHVCLSFRLSVCTQLSRLMSLFSTLTNLSSAPQEDELKPGRDDGSSSLITVCTTLSTQL